MLSSTQDTREAGASVDALANWSLGTRASLRSWTASRRSQGDPYTVGPVRFDIFVESPAFQPVSLLISNMTKSQQNKDISGFRHSTFPAPGTSPRLSLRLRGTAIKHVTSGCCMALAGVSPVWHESCQHEGPRATPSIILDEKVRHYGNLRKDGAVFETITVATDPAPERALFAPSSVSAR